MQQTTDRIMNQTGVPDRRLHGVALLQQRLDERRGDVPYPPPSVTHAVFLLSTRDDDIASVDDGASW
jgi:hypothetical protein